MTGLWLASYMALWVVVILVVLLQLGTLREVGLLQQTGRRVASGNRDLPPPHEDGPVIGSFMPELALEAHNGCPPVDLSGASSEKATLLMFMSPVCEGCQLVVDPLNAVTAHHSGTVRAVVILRGNEVACRSFLSIFPLRMPTVFDTDNAITDSFGVHHNPYGLLYDEGRLLVRKGSIQDENELAALLGDASAPTQSIANVFPPPTRSVDVAPLGGATSSLE